MDAVTSAPRHARSAAVIGDGTRSSTRRPGRLRLVVLAIAGLVLVGTVLASSLPAFLADAAPTLAVRLGDSSARAQLNIAEQMLQDLAIERARSADTSDDGRRAPPDVTARSDLIRAAIERALARSPLNPRALRQLGQLDMLAGDVPGATRVMAAATRQSIRETIAVSWMLERSLDARDFTAATVYADMALRTRSEMLPVVGPILARLAETREGRPEVTRLLDANPPWRPRFMALLPAVVTDMRTPLDLLLYLKDTAVQPSRADLKSYLDHLITNRRYDLAYYTWLQFLPPEQLGSLGLLFNGTFDIPTSGLPFDWQFPAGIGVSAQIAIRDDQPRENALRVLFSQGRATFGGVSQLTMLAPGTYRFEGVYKGELAGRRGLQWKVSCRDAAGAPLAASRMFNGVSKTWTPFDFEFTVPAAGCTAQTVQLFLDARSESEKLLTGVAWFDRLTIAREAAE